MDSEDDQDPPNDPVLAKNVTKLMAGRGIQALRDEMAVAGIRIGAGTLQKAASGDSGIRYGSLQKIAGFYGVTVAQLMQPELGYDDASAWPFSIEMRQLVAKLQPVDLVNMERAMWTQQRQDMPVELHYSADVAHPLIERDALDKHLPLPSVTKVTRRGRTR
jgi:hypothetical protein